MMKGGLGGLMKQAQQMQQNMQKAQAELATMEVEGQAGSGMVKVVMTCGHEVRRVSLDDSVLSDDKEMLEDLIVLALNDAVKKVAALSEQKMSGFSAGMSLPPGMKLPF
jgi:DNA-binding YbaB/EbfC family protein